MAGGSWNDGGRTPSHMLAWCKLKLGWINPTVIFNNSQNVTIKPSANYDQVYMLPVGSQSSKEYFLLENRKKIGFDRFLPGEGLLITHVDESQSNNNDQTHYLVDIEQADGKMELNKNANQGDPNDPYPIAGNNSFSASTTPSSKSYSGSDSKVSVTGIERAGDNIVAAINVGGVVADEAKWYNNVKITSTYAYYTSQWAWAYVQGVGWRRIKDGSPDAVTNMFTLCCQALANKRPVKVYADANFIYTAYLL
jgi:immune inhibitor A